MTAIRLFGAGSTGHIANAVPAAVGHAHGMPTGMQLGADTTDFQFMLKNRRALQDERTRHRTEPQFSW